MVEAAAEVWLEQGAALMRTRRAVGLVDEALRGRTFLAEAVRVARWRRVHARTVRLLAHVVSVLAGTTVGTPGGLTGPLYWTHVARPDGLLSQVHSPADLRALDPEQLAQLAAEIRAFLIENVSQTGGHLGPNLGVVELTIALHRVFDSPTDPIVFDTGHQSYVHKMLTGRQDAVPDAAAAARARRLPEPGRVRARLGRELATPRPRSRTPTGWPRRSGCSTSRARWSPSSATAR